MGIFRGIAALAVALVVLTGCGGNGDSDRAQALGGSSPSPATAAAPSPSPSPAGAGTGAAAAAPRPTPTPRPAGPDLARALLTLDDLPAGWSPAAPSGPSQNTPCGQPLPPLADAAAELHRADFARAPTAGPFLRHSVARFPAGMAQALLDRWRQAFEQCPQWEEPAPQGGIYQIRAAPLAFPPLGDQTLAIRYNIGGGGTAAQADQIVIRRGDVLSGLTVTTVGPGAAQPFDAMLLEQLARTADEKLPAARER